MAFVPRSRGSGGAPHRRCRSRSRGGGAPPAKPRRTSWRPWAADRRFCWHPWLRCHLSHEQLRHHQLCPRIPRGRVVGKIGKGAHRILGASQNRRKIQCPECWSAPSCRFSARGSIRVSWRIGRTERGRLARGIVVTPKSDDVPESLVLGRASHGPPLTSAITRAGI